MKVSIIGVGKVGSSLAYVLGMKSYVRQLVLVGRRLESAQGDALDLRHGQCFAESPIDIIAGTAQDTRDSDIIAFCASVPSPTEVHSRLGLASANVALLKESLPALAKLSPEAKIVIVSNPVDVLVDFALKYTSFPAAKIMGTGTLVDSARFRQLLAEEIQIHAEDIRAYILGEHGDSQFAALSCADAGGEPIETHPQRLALARQAADAGYEVFRLKGHTNYAIALAAAYIIESIALDSKRTMPISLKIPGYFGVHDVCLSLPAVVGKDGIKRVLQPKLNAEERQAFRNCAQVIKSVVKTVEREQSGKHQAS